MLTEGQKASVAYEDEDVVVRTAFVDSNVCFVTFTSLNHKHPTGFGEKFLSKQGYSAVHFIAKWNHWYRLPQMAEVIERINAQVRSHNATKIITYGSSMGASAAAYYSKAFAADKVIAFSPQFSIDPHDRPFESRWAEHALKISWSDRDTLDGVAPQASKYYFFDPQNPDKKHVELYETISGTTLVKLCSAEHNIAEVLKDAGLLKTVILDIVEERFNISEFNKKYRLDRRKSPLFWANLSARILPRYPALALHAANQGLHLSHRNLRLHVTRCIALLRLEREENAIEAAREALEIAPNHPAPWRVISVANQRLNRSHESVAAAKTAVSCRPNDPDLRRVLLDALLQAGLHAEAAEQARVSIALAPNYAPGYVRGAEALEANGELNEAIQMVRQGQDLIEQEDPQNRKLIAILNRLAEKVARGRLPSHKARIYPDNNRRVTDKMP